jgi:outer membrane protein OmpA-like peptidoglycan-associated protein
VNQPRTRGRPGPALTFGLPLLLVSLVGYFGVRGLRHLAVNASPGVQDPTHPPSESTPPSRPSGNVATLVASSGVTPRNGPASSSPVTAAATAAKAGALTLPGISFGEASYQLDAAAQATIADVAEKLQPFPTMCIRIIGYSTRREDPDPAHRLSRLRGLAVAQELTRLQPTTFPASRFDVRGLGADRTDEGKSVSKGAKARKTEFALFTCATK